MSNLEPKEWKILVAKPKEKASLKAVYNQLFPDYSVKRPAGLPPPRSFEAIQAEKMARYSFLKNEFARRMMRKSFFEHPIHGEAMLFDPGHERWMYAQMRSDLIGKVTKRTFIVVALVLLPVPIISYCSSMNSTLRMEKYALGYKSDLNIYRFHDMFYGC